MTIEHRKSKCRIRYFLAFGTLICWSALAFPVWNTAPQILATENQSSPKAPKTLEIAQKAVKKQNYNLAIEFSNMTIILSHRYILSYGVRAYAWIETKICANAIEDLATMIQLYKNAHCCRYHGGVFCCVWVI
jgi:hypothetical protein